MPFLRLSFLPSHAELAWKIPGPSSGPCVCVDVPRLVGFDALPLHPVL